MFIQNEILDQIISSLQKKGQDSWINKIQAIKALDIRRIHIAVMIEPYLSLILNGKKTVESRFSRNKISPYSRINKGDLVILKKSGGGYVAVFEAGNVKFLEPQNESDIQKIKEDYNDMLCISDDFWHTKKDSRYATLIYIANICRFDEFQLSVPNRKSWIDFVEERGVQESMNIKSTIICIAGKAGSGKTTLAKYLSSQMNCRYVTVSDFLRSLCIGDQITREILQEKGNECIKNGWDSFVHDFLRYVNWDGKGSLIIDGIRHVPFMEMLRIYLFPIRPICIFLDADDETLDNHIAIRGNEIIDRTPISEGFNQNMYICADLIIPVKHLSISDIAGRIQGFISMYNNTTSDDNTSIRYLRQYIDGFNSRRGWKKYHNPRDVAMSISIEAAELLEIFQWGNRGKAREHIKDELADVMIYCIDLANCMGLDVTDVVLNKLIKNASKYPE